MIRHNTGRGITYTLGNTLGNNGDGADLGVLHQLHGGGVDGARRGEVDNGVNVGVLGHGLLNILVDGKESLAGTPVHLADELTTEGVDNTRYGRSGALADEIEIEHALHGSGLHTTDVSLVSHVEVVGAESHDLLHEASCLVVEKAVLGGREDTARRGKAGDVVVGRLHAVAGGESRGGHDESRLQLACKLDFEAIVQ